MLATVVAVDLIHDRNTFWKGRQHTNDSAVAPDGAARRVHLP